MARSAPVLAESSDRGSHQLLFVGPRSAIRLDLNADCTLGAHSSGWRGAVWPSEGLGFVHQTQTVSLPSPDTGDLLRIKDHVLPLMQSLPRRS